MINQVNLKDEKYLQEYEAQINKLPLEELYEILDMIQKDPSPERIHIVEARIRYLEEHPCEKPEGLFPDLEENAEDSIKTSDCITCPKCLGQKKRLEWLFGKCKKCDGKGFIQMAICPDCLGEGRASDQAICKTCKGKKIIRANEAKQIKWYQRMCSEFVAKPEILVLSSLATIGALAFCARILSGLYFLDRHFLEITSETSTFFSSLPHWEQWSLRALSREAPASWNTRQRNTCATRWNVHELQSIKIYRFPTGNKNFSRTA